MRVKHRRPLLPKQSRSIAPAAFFEGLLVPFSTISSALRVRQGLKRDQRFLKKKTDFLNPEKISKRRICDMKKQSIRNFIKDVSTAISPNEVRTALAHMRVLCKPDRLVFTGTNGIKLIEKTHPVETGWDKEVFIPGVLVKGYANLSWYRTKDIKDNLAAMRLHNSLTKCNFEYPDYEPLLKFSHRQGNIRKTVDRETTLDFLKKAVPSLDREDHCRFALTQLGWGIDCDADGGYLYQLLKALHSDKLLVRYDSKHKFITIIGENERALLTLLRRRRAEA